jgi:transposase-like protein
MVFIHLAPDYATAQRRARALITRFKTRYASAMERLEEGLEECIVYLGFPREHRRRIRTTNPLERTFGEGRRRTKAVPRFPTEGSCLKLLYATLATASRGWHGAKMTPKAIRELDRVRAEIYPLKAVA